MGRFRTTALAITLASSAVLAIPGLAHADPTVNFTDNGQATGDGGTMTVGDSISITGLGCANPTPGGPAYMGEFFSLGADPADGAMGQAEQQVDQTGSFSWSTVMDPNTTTGVIESRWYCSTAPAGSITDPNMLWVSAPYSMTINPSAGAAKVLVSVRNSTVTMRSSTQGGISFTTDPDGLPLVDRIGIFGPEAAIIKHNTDAAYATVAPIQRLYTAFLNRVGDHAGMAYWMNQVNQGVSTTVIADQFADSAQFQRSWGSRPAAGFVDAAFQNVLGRSADPASRAYWIDQLNTGQTTKARLVWTLANSDENIARTRTFTYAVAAFQTLSAKTPEVSAVQTFADRLTAGQCKVKVVEDIALSLNGKASTWMKLADTGALPVA